jgi:hypothetical protein
VLGFGITGRLCESCCLVGQCWMQPATSSNHPRHGYRLEGDRYGRFHHHGEKLALKCDLYSFTHLLPYDYPDLTLFGGAGVAVLRTAWAAAGQYAASGPPPRTACALRRRSLAPDRGGDCRRILQHQRLDDDAAAEVPEYRGSDHKGLGHGVISTGSTMV